MNLMRLLVPCALLGAVNAHAQSNVTIYGVIDTGVSYVSNQGGKWSTSMANGILSPNLIGFTGSEDLGGGLKAIFKMENQFNVGNGQMLGNLFGHQAYVGLQSDTLGKLTMGNLDDFMFSELAVKRYGPMFRFVSIQNLRQGPYNALGIPNVPGGSFDFDRVAEGQRVASAIRYDSVQMNGFSFGTLLGLGGTAGSFANGSTKSFGADYSNGPFTLTGAYTDVKYMTMNNGADGIRNWGVGGRYDIGDMSFDALYTNTKNTMTGAVIDVFEAGVLVPITKQLNLLTAFTATKGNAALSNNKSQQVDFTLHYTLSKRTALYSSFMWQKASGGPDAKAWITLAGESGGSVQSVFRLGMQHAF